MNEYKARVGLVKALGATGPIGNERQFWTTVLTALKGSYASARTEHEFWSKFNTLLAAKVAPLPATQTIVENGDVLPGTGGDFTVVVSGGAVTGGTWAAD